MQNDPTITRFLIDALRQGFPRKGVQPQSYLDFDAQMAQQGQQPPPVEPQPTGGAAGGAVDAIRKRHQMMQQY